MNVIIDAQLVAGYYREVEVGEAPAFSASTVTLLNRLGVVDQGFVDTGGVLEQEYRDVVDPDWFEAWYAQRLAEGHFEEVDAPPCPDLIRCLVVSCGFPRGSKDRHYIALAAAVSGGKRDPSSLITEDLDFYDPTQKQVAHKRRMRILQKQTGCVAKELKRAHVVVRCVKGHLAS